MGKKRNRIARLVCVWKISSSHRLRLEDVVVASTLLGCKRLARERERERRYTTTTTLYGAIGNPLPLPASFIFQPNSSSSLPLSLGKLERNPSRSLELCAMAANTQHTSNRIFNSREELPLFFVGGVQQLQGGEVGCHVVASKPIIYRAAAEQQKQKHISQPRQPINTFPCLGTREMSKKKEG